MSSRKFLPQSIEYTTLHKTLRKPPTKTQEASPAKKHSKSFLRIPSQRSPILKQVAVYIQYIFYASFSYPKSDPEK